MSTAIDGTDPVLRPQTIAAFLDTTTRTLDIVFYRMWEGSLTTDCARCLSCLCRCCIGRRFRQGAQPGICHR